MRTRLLLAAFCILALPMWFSPSKGDKLTNSTPFATVALAGHTNVGNWCQCGCPACICDVGEIIDTCGGAPRPAPVQNPGKAKPSQGSGLDFGAGGFLIGLALLLWSRLRA